MNREFQNGKKEMDNAVESSLSFFNARDEAQHRMTFLREKAERDLSIYNIELKVRINYPTTVEYIFCIYFVTHAIQH